MVKTKSAEPYAIDDLGCWVWLRTKTGRGYGFTYHGGKQLLAHRHYYMTFNGDIPKGYVIDHLCGNTSCVNPKHLEAITQSVNLLRSMARRGKYLGTAEGFRS